MDKETILRDLDICVCRECGVLFHLQTAKNNQYDNNKIRQIYRCPVCKEEIPNG